MDPGELMRMCRDPGFTPATQLAAPLVELWRGAHKRDRKVIVTALSRGGAPLAEALLASAHDAPGAERAMRVKVAGRIHRSHPLASFEEALTSYLEDPAPPVVREAARVVGKLEGDDLGRFEPALLMVCLQAQRPEKKAAVEALGRVGGPRSESTLREMPDEDDPDLRRRIDEALALLHRRAGRSDKGRVVPDRELPVATDAVLRYRADVGWVVAEQLGDVVAVSRGDSRAVVTGTYPLDRLLAARSVVDVGLRFELPNGEDLAERIVAGLKGRALLEAMRTWTDGPIRFRLALRGAGRQRSVVWKVADAAEQRGLGVDQRLA